VLLSEAEQTVSLETSASPVWVHPNAEERGYYRWSVPPDMLQALAAGAPQSLSTRERVGLLSNASALLDAGLLHGDEYLGMLKRFADDPEPEVVSTVLAGLEKVNVAFITPAVSTSYGIAVRSMLRPALKRFGIARVRGEAEAVSLLRPNLLSTLGTYGRDPQVMAWARATGRRYLDHPDSVDASVAGTALNLMARDGDLDLFDEYRERFETTRIPSERTRYLTALGKFRGGGLLERALDYALTGPLRPHEIFTIPRSLTEDQALRDRQWGWFKSHYRVIVKKIPPFYVPDLPEFASCCRADRIEEAKVFFSMSETDRPGTQEELAKVVDSIRDCVGLKEREEQAVLRYLTESAQAHRTPGVVPGP
jgi:alanyl aminopeptidase